MRRVVPILAAGLLTLALAVPAMAANDKNDVGVEFGPPIEGNTFVQTNDTGDDVRIVIKLQKTRPDQSLYYEVWCGPNHANAGILAALGEMTTNGQGNGNTGAFWVDMTVCRGSGDRTGHVDVGGFSSTSAELTSPFSYN